MSYLATVFLVPFVCLQVATGAQYLGCFLDDATNREFRVSNNMGAGITVQGCVNYCTSQAYKYAALQKNTCYCGESYGKYSKVDNSKCNSACGGQSQQMCGADRKNSVYATDYLGCWRDAPTRDIPMFNAMASSEAKLETCINLCKNAGFKYAGAQYYDQCFCGNKFGMYGERPRSDCSATCRGNSSQKCGGVWANSVFVAKEDCGCQ